MAEQFPIDMMNEGDIKNWTKVGLAFYETKDVLVHIVESEWSAEKTKPNQKRASEADIYYLLKFINENEEKYPDQEFQRAAKKVRSDRNMYIHDLTKAKVTEEQLTEWTGDMVHLLQIVENQWSTEQAGQIMKRINEIVQANYRIVQADENKAKLSFLEGQFQKMEHVLQKHGDEIQSIRESLRTQENSSDDFSVGHLIKDRIDKVEGDMMKRLSIMKSTIDEVKNKVDYLMDQDPHTQEEQRSANYIQRLRSTPEWDPRSEIAISQLLKKYQLGDLTLVDKLIAEGVSLRMEHLEQVVQADNVSGEIVKHLINHLKVTDQWNANSVPATQALETVNSLRRDNLISLLLSEGIKYAAEESGEENVDLIALLKEAMDRRT